MNSMKTTTQSGPQKTTGETGTPVRFRGNSTKPVVGVMLIFVFVLIAYSNSFQASWHFDDYPAILSNPHLHLNDLQPESLRNTLFASPEGGRYLSKKMYRPVPCLSFALNWYFGKDNVVGYHVVNLLVHFLTAVFVYFSTLSILMTPNMKGKYHGQTYTIALLTSLIWAVHPIQTQAVTYIVQRMAALSAMFFVLSLWFFMKFRLGKSRQRYVFLAGCGLAYILAIGSKENAAILPASLALVEIVFFQNLSGDRGKRLAVWGALACIFLFIMAVIVLTSSNHLSGYNHRGFTMTQRLMTEPRVVLFYLSQIILPLPGRFSIEHDFYLYKTVLDPWTTIPALLAIVALITSGIFQIRKRPIWAFPILFFFLNHVVESTAIPLEIAFEHRNYLPSAFLFLPLAVGCSTAIKYVRKNNRYLSGVVTAGVCLLILFLVGSTFLRNDAWASEKTLWEDALSKAPLRIRPYQNLAFNYYEKIGRYDVALKLYNKALTLSAASPKRSRAQLLTNIGAIYDKAGKYQQAYNLFQEALVLAPKELRPRYNSVSSLVGMGKWEEALRQVDDLILRKPEDRDSHNIKGLILIKLGRPAEAIPSLQNALKAEPKFLKALVNLGIARYQIGQYEQAELTLLKAHLLSPSHGLPLFCLVENSLRANDTPIAAAYLQRLFDTISRDEIETVMASMEKDNNLAPISKKILGPVIDRMMAQTAQIN